ncbi:MAG TPA: retropepsin-like aspartic protease [Candidatus Aquilonibacter sp.]|nr:retropepsin-like aspartic protease [Candidatus Aquilonibacter sp.]
MLFAARLALLFAVVLAATVPAARADDLTTLFDRMRARSGPVWRTHLTSSSIIAYGHDTTAVRSESLGLRFSTYECAGNLCDGSYFDGERIYAININGTRLPQSDTNDPFLRGERVIASLMFLSPNFAKDGGTVTDAGTQAIDDIRYRVIIVSDGDATPMRVFIDPKSDTVRYLQDLNADSTIEYRDYRQVDGGLYLPFSVMRNGEVLERYQARGITTDEFAPPHGLVPSFSGKTAVVATNEYRSVPIFACELGGVKTNCLLDSGNSGLAISDSLAKRLHTPLVGSFVVRGLGNYTTDVVRAGGLRLGNATYGPANYVVLHDIEKFGYQVVLGADVFASTTIALDPVAHTITFGAPIPASASSVRLIFQNFVPVLTVRLGNLGTQLALDTGDDSTINLAYEFYSEHPNLFSVTEQRPVSGIGGTSTELIGTIPEIKVGDISMTHQPIGTTTSLHGTAFGHLGAGFIEQFRVVIDYAGGAVYFTPTPAPSP